MTIKDAAKMLSSIVEEGNSDLVAICNALVAACDGDEQLRALEECTGVPPISLMLSLQKSILLLPLKNQQEPKTVGSSVKETFVARPVNLDAEGFDPKAIRAKLDAHDAKSLAPATSMQELEERRRTRVRGSDD